MKKILCLLVMVLIILTACNKQVTENADDGTNEEDISQAGIVDIKDEKALKEYIMENHNEIDETNYNDGNLKYFDYTKDGNDDAVYYLDYSRDCPALFLTIKDGELFEIKHELESWYSQDVNFTKDFILYKSTYGGSGISDQYMDICIYENEEIKHTGATILLEGHSSGPDYMVERTGEVIFDHEGDYKSFTYIEAQTGTDTYEKEYRYVYDEDAKQFDIEELSNNESDDNCSEAQANDNTNSNVSIFGLHVQSLEWNQGVVNVQLEGTLNNITGYLVYDAYFNSFGIEVFDGNINGAEVTVSGNVAYISGNGFIPMSEDMVLNAIDGEMAGLVKNGLVLSVTCNIVDLAISQDVSFDYGDLSGQVDITSWEVAEKAGALSKYESEMLHSKEEEVYIDYSQYHLVVIPMQDSIHASNLSSRTIDVTDTGNEFPLKFIVLGELDSLQITYYENPLDNSIEPITLQIEGPIKDEVVTVNAYLPTDFSYVEITADCIYMSGIESVTFTLDDMRDDTSYEIFTFDACYDLRRY